MKKFDVAALQSHAQETIKVHSIKFVLHNKSLEYNCYDCNTKEIEVSPVIDEKTYWGFLHECAHAIYNHSLPEPYRWDDEVKMEIEAWEWVYANSVIPVSDAYKQEVFNFRLKGSWE